MITITFTDKEIMPTEEKFLVGIDNIEFIENGLYEFIFDGILQESFNDLQGQDIRQVYEKISAYFFKGDFRGEIYKKFDNLQKMEILSRWLLITVTDVETDLKVTQYVDDNQNNEGIVRYISSISSFRFKSESALKFDAFFSWKTFEISSEEQILNALNLSDRGNSDFHKLNVYNVGQGSLCSIATEDNIPLIYFDMGGGWKFFHRTYPTTKKLCFTYAKTIILSHWDWDHLETARRYSVTNDWNQFQNKTWIVPEQDMTASYMKFLCKMTGISNVIIWPKRGLDRLKFWGGEIIKCNGTSKNDSGLALIVVCKSNNVQNVLHPGDAAFQHIPFLSEYVFEGLVATHHGANFELNNSNIPSNFEKHLIAYSYAVTRYGHPKASAVSAYKVADWNNRLDTTNGSISFAFTANIVPPCGNLCDLIIDQTF